MPNPGDAWDDYITTDWYQRVTDAADRLRQGIGDRTDPSLVSDRVTVYNHTTTVVPRFTPIALGNPKTVSYNPPVAPVHTFGNLSFETADLSVADQHNWVVLLEELPASQDIGAEALLIGITWIRLNANPSINKRLTVGGLGMEAGSSGRGYIWKHFTDGTEHLALVSLAHPGMAGLEDVRYNFNGNKTFEKKLNGVWEPVFYTGPCPPPVV